jgi:plastocyanin
MTPHSTTRRGLLATAGSAAAVAVAGCFGDAAVSSGAEPATDGTGQLGDPAQRVEVRMRSFPEPAVEPNLVHVQPGGTVVWVGEGLRNTTTAYHPETNGPQRIPDGAEPWDSGLLREDAQFTHTFEEAGIYDYADTTELCGSHESFGIVGRVVVGHPDLEEEIAIQHDPEELPSLATNTMVELNEQCRRELG